MPEELVRRPLKTRSKAWPKALALKLVKLGLTPNHISVLSIFFAIAAAVCFAGCSSIWLPGLSWPFKSALLIAAAAFIQLRLLCNLLDGLMAVEGGKKSPVGEIYNELPDRFADVIILVAASFAAPSFPYVYELGWIAAAMSLLTAYIRALGGSLGLKQDFCGPMAKPHRMFALTMGCFAGAIEFAMRKEPIMPGVALAIIVLGTIVTSIRRTSRIAKLLEAR